MKDKIHEFDAVIVGSGTSAYCAADGLRKAGRKIAIIDNAINEILGAHIARHNTSEAINILALAMKHHIKAADLADFMWAYPTITSDLKYMVK
jgi:pyruvate/2-oxoglutarate dehydrogenase complex dihydrolipoamide dehydrogenase (E3) component